ncbi:MAG: ISAs1 family transposase [Chloroflexi bacterium]|nr:ISAs1 family transposase [Chloroflexota bacterium]
MSQAIEGEAIITFCGTNAVKLFKLAGMSKTTRMPAPDEQRLLDQLLARLLEPSELPRFNQLLDAHHYLHSLKPFGERLYYVVTDVQGHWLALLLFSAAAKHLKLRERWIGWTREQARRRLSLVVNNSRFLVLPDKSVPNLATKALRLVLDRLSDDWQARYGHPVVVVETFVDPEQFYGTVYTANGWEELGQTDGWGRHRRDYYVKHDRPKRLFVRELCRQARRSLQAEHLKPDLARVEAQVPPRCTLRVKEIQSMTEQFKQVPEYRDRVESYPLWSLLTLVLLAVLCEAPRGQKDLEKFARGFSRGQRRALGIRRNPQGKYPAPSQSTFCRFFQRVEGRKVEEALWAIQEQVRGQAPKEDLVVLDGKEPKHRGGQAVLSAVTVPSQFYLGSALVEKDKTNEIPVARELFKRLDLEGRLVSLDALHTQDETARALVLDHGADYLLTVKDNQSTVHENIQQLIAAPAADFPPSEAHAHASPHPGNQQGTAGEPVDPHGGADGRTNRLSFGRTRRLTPAPEPGPQRRTGLIGHRRGSG